MKTWIWTLVVFAAAVGLALVLREHSGNVLIIAQPWRIELSLTRAVLLLLAAFILFHLLLRFFAWLGAGPGRFRSWRVERAEKRDHELLESGWISVLEGRYTEAEKDLAKLLGKTKVANRKVLAGLASARAAHHLGETERRDRVLAAAHIAAGKDNRLQEAVATVSAEMFLDQNRAQDALVLLQPLQDASSRYFHATRLLLRAHKMLGNYDRVYELTRLLLRRSVIDKSEAMPLIALSTVERLRATDVAGFKTIWNDLKADEKCFPDIALEAAALHVAKGQHDEATKILEAALNVQQDARLLNAWAQCPPEQVAYRLSKAEGWLKVHPDDSSLLAALGNLCLTGQLWGQGERYLVRSMKLRSDMRIHALLGNLYDRLGRTNDAMQHWRLASSVAGVLPILPGNQLLPAADTRDDPTLIDVDRLPAAPVSNDFVDVPMAASAVGLFTEDHDYPESGLPPKSVPAPASVSASTDDGLDDYFDSAPIPGVDLSQTSDNPNRNE